MAKTTLNTEGESSAHSLIRAGHYDMNSPWSFSAEDGDKLLGAKGDDWDKFGRWHLGEDPSEPKETKAHWKYPYGKDGKVYRRALAAIRSRASQNGDTTVYDAAGRLMRAMDEEEGKKESSMSLTARLLNSVRFGHLAGNGAPPAAAAAESEDDKKKREDGERDSNEKETGKRETNAERAAREKAEDDEEARKSRRSKKRGQKKSDAEDGDPDGDDASDDDEDGDDDEEMKRAASAGHEIALEAAYRAGARAQRRRCTKILDSKAAAANLVLACSLAFETSMTAAAAIAVLEKTPAPAARGGLATRMAESGADRLRVAPSAPEAPKGAAAIAASWDHAAKDFIPPR